MAICKRKATRKVVVAPWQIEEAVLGGLVRPASHARGKIAHVYAVFTHIEKHKDL